MTTKQVTLIQKTWRGYLYKKAYQIALEQHREKQPIIRQCNCSKCYVQVDSTDTNILTMFCSPTIVEPSTHNILDYFVVPDSLTKSNE